MLTIIITDVYNLWIEDISKVSRARVAEHIFAIAELKAY